ncbi:MAG: endolytic transglycosylase MltG [Bacilli bacterium]|nr:endolytic transglycosylase MltG [Bacilli bacterium]
MARRKIKKKVKRTIILLTVTGIFLILTSITYCYLATPMDKNSTATIEVDIESGMTSKQIGDLLRKKGLIRSSSFFLLYTKMNNCSYLKAATYDLKKSMTMDEILTTICTGLNYSKEAINITFKEGKRITDYAELIEKETNNTFDDVINTIKNKEYIKTLINKYWFLTEEVLNDEIYYPLEGYLFPDTYQFKNKNVTPKEIIEKLLDREEEILEAYKEKLTNKKHTIHEYIALASMAELEGTNTENRKKIIGVFENRLKKGMNLGSDVTTYYAFQKSMSSGDLTKKEFATFNPYNTRAENMLSLPVGPICSISSSSLEATTEPENNFYYYFVADKLGNIYYTKTNEEHLKKAQEIKDAGNWIW